MTSGPRSALTRSVASVTAAFCYLLGSMAFLWEGLFKAGVVLFIVGSLSFLTVAVGDAVERHHSP